MPSSPQTTRPAETGERSHFSSPGAVEDSLRRPMAERLELALSWNRLASELEAGLEKQRRDPRGT